ncbi:MAG: DNA-3-methyladenine glycosylase 2 family protein [Phycisphaerae bacterium]|jgi:DNA-3-methyladenine glycosylase II
MSALIDRIGPFNPTITRNPFTALVGSIIHQQISMRAATSIQSKLRAVCAGGRIRPQTLLALDVRRLRGAGLSRQKAGYLLAVAKSFDDGVLSASRLRRMSDAEVIEAATELPGVGRWTAEMLLMFSLERPDVWPADDLGLRSALRRFLPLRELPTPRAARPLGDRWAPFRTYACWYLWRSLENPVLPGIAGAL